MWKVVTSFNLNTLLKLFFYSPILTNNNLLFKIYCENIVVAFLNEDFFIFYIIFHFFQFILIHQFSFLFSCFYPPHTRVQPISIPPPLSFIFFFSLTFKNTPDSLFHSLALSFFFSFFFTFALRFLFLLDSRTLSSMIFWLLFALLFSFLFSSLHTHSRHGHRLSFSFLFFLPSFLVLIHFVVTMELRQAFMLLICCFCFDFRFVVLIKFVFFSVLICCLYSDFRL